jgi:hypothetical protein
MGDELALLTSRARPDESDQQNPEHNHHHGQTKMPTRSVVGARRPGPQTSGESPVQRLTDKLPGTIKLQPGQKQATRRKVCEAPGVRVA